MIELTDAQLQAVEKGEPLRIASAGAEFVVLRADVYERLQALCADDQGFAADVYPQVMEVFGKTGWNEPAMDIYDDLDPRRRS